MIRRREISAFQDEFRQRYAPIRKWPCRFPPVEIPKTRPVGDPEACQFNHELDLEMEALTVEPHVSTMTIVLKEFLSRNQCGFLFDPVGEKFQIVKVCPFEDQTELPFDLGSVLIAINGQEVKPSEDMGTLSRIDGRVNIYLNIYGYRNE